MKFFDETTTIVENLYHLSGPLLVVISLIGLQQLAIAKNSIRITSQRESAKLAIKLCDKYFKELSNIYAELVPLFRELEIDYEKLEMLNLNTLDKIDEKAANYAEYQKAISNLGKLEYNLWAMADKLETFSVPFINGIADEKIAYNVQINKFIQYCNLCSVEIIESRNKNPHNKILYESVIKLYSIWKQRNDNEHIDHQIYSLFIKKSNIKSQGIKPLGTE